MNNLCPTCGEEWIDGSCFDHSIAHVLMGGHWGSSPVCICGWVPDGVGPWASELYNHLCSHSYEEWQRLLTRAEMERM